MNEGTDLFGGVLSDLWAAIVSGQGDVFYTAKNLPFTYTVKGGELFTDRRKRSITRSTFERAYKKMLADPGIKGPKKLGVYGAPYVWAVLKKLVALSAEEKENRSL